MNELDFVNAIAELIKQNIDRNPNFSEWEKWWRKSGIDETKELAKQFYEQQQRFQKQEGQQNG